MRLVISALSVVLASLSFLVSAWIPHRFRIHHRYGVRQNGLAADNGVHQTALLQATANHPDIFMFNSKSRQKEKLLLSTINNNKNNKKRRITMYTCGPTVYDYAHIGNFRAFLTYDLLKRVLCYFGYNVFHVCNITDVDDKIIVRANEQKLTDVSELTLKFEKLFLKDLSNLNCVPATIYPRATEHIPAMIRLVQDLHHLGLAYETDDSSWYFDTQQQATYGQQLVKLNYEDMMEQKETENADGKKHFADFCLWKAFKENVDRNDVAWDSSMFKEKPKETESSDELEQLKNQQPWPLESPELKLGRPGWHLECSAMAKTYFGTNTLDFHGGGIDLKFPHHENEIAQSEGANQNTFCNCWFHNGFVNIGDEKMSKSLGNFLTLNTACKDPLEIRAYRYLVVSSHYRSALTFTESVMKAAKKAIKRMDKVVAELKQIVADNEMSDSDSELASTTVPKALENFEAAISDDLSMPRASAALFSLIKSAENEFKSHKKSGKALDIAGLKSILEAIENMDQVFGIFYNIEGQESAQGEQAVEVPTEVLELVGQRTAAKEAKDWELADSLRKRITELGFAIKDVKDGDPIVTPVEN